MKTCGLSSTMVEVVRSYTMHTSRNFQVSKCLCFKTVLCDLLLYEHTHHDIKIIVYLLRGNKSQSIFLDIATIYPKITH